MATNVSGFRKIRRIGGMKIPAAGLLLSILFFAGGCGCGKNEPPKPATSKEDLPTVVTNRMADPTYLQEMEAIRRKQNQLAQERGKVVMQMEQKVAAAKAKLPKATDAEIRAELEKDPEWKTLEKENEKRIQKIQADWAEARMAGRARLAKERDALRAVSEGRAKVAEEEGRGK